MCVRLLSKFLLILILPVTLSAQKIIQQEKLDNIDKVLNSKNGEFLLVKSGDDYTLIEAKSRIQLGSMYIPDYNNGHTGQGKISFVNDSRFVVNTLDDILLVDIINQKIDTLGLNNRFPEIIENFLVLPGEQNQILITTKFYPMDKDETIQFSTSNKDGEAKFDDTKNCRLYLFDYAENKILNSVAIPHSITAISDNGTDIFAGTFEGKILRISTDLLYEELFSAGNEPVFYLNQTGQKFVVIPHLAKAVLNGLGKGEVRVFDGSGNSLQTIDLPEQPYPIDQDEDSFITLSPSDLVKNVLYLQDDNSLLINYGFNKVLKYHLQSGISNELKIDKKFATFHNLHSVDSQVLVTASDEKEGLFNNPSSLAVYDLNLQKDIALFFEADPIIKYSKLKKIYSNNNYYYYGKIDSYGELSVIYPSNKSYPTFLKYPDGTLDIDENNNLLLVASDQIIYGKFNVSGIKQDTLTLRFGWNKNLDQLPPEVFQPHLNSRNFKETVLPYGVTGIRKIGADNFMVAGYNQDLKYFYILIDQNGKILFERKNVDRALLGYRIELSPSGKFFAMDFKKGKSSVLEIWDWKNDKLVYSTKFKDSERWSYRFDPNEELLWLKLDDLNNFSSIKEIDFKALKPDLRVVLPKISTSDFVADKARNQIATTDARGFAVLELSTGRELWSVSNSNLSESMEHSSQGFDLGTDQHFYSVNSDNFSSVYFTSFEGYKPIEISSELYYSGEKSALKNIAFISGGRGYLPSDYDLYLNRPDKVLLESGSTNDEYHDLLGKAIEKRTAVLPTKDFLTFLDRSPELLILERDSIPSYTSAKEEIIKLSLKSSTGTNLASYHVNINGVPLHGKEGKKIKGMTTEFEAEVKLMLSKGANTIQLYGIDDDGFISNKEVVSIFGDYQEPSKTYLILLSADTYKNSDFNLKYPVKDARDLAINLQKRYGKNLIVDSLFNENITLDNLKKIEGRLSEISVNDRVILFLSGHGVLDSNFEFRFATPEMDFDQVDSYGITNTQIEKFLLSSPAREKLLLIDACHSGEFDREQYAQVKATTENQEVKIYEGSKGAVGSDVRPSDSTFELMNQIFTDVSEATGIKVISAAAGNSFALESDKWNNGVFTFSLLSTLREHELIPISELKKKTFEKVVRLTNGYQQPTSRGETIEFDFSL